MDTCTPKGRDCIEANSTSMFNCSTTCVGIYADVQWEEMGDLVQDEWRMGRGKEIDRDKFKEMVLEYKRFKKENMRHFRFNAAGDSPAFGKLNMS